MVGANRVIAEVYIDFSVDAGVLREGGCDETEG